MSVMDTQYRLLPDNMSFTHRFTEDVYKVLNLNGFPPAFYSKDKRLVTPSPLFIERKKKKSTVVETVSVEEQKHFYKAFLDTQIFDPVLIAVCGLPTERAALTTLTSLMVRRVERYGILDCIGMYCINSIHKCSDLIPILDRPRVVIVHNIHTRASQERLLNIRDILTTCAASTRFVVVLSNDPDMFIRKKLNLKPDVILNIRG